MAELTDKARFSDKLFNVRDFVLNAQEIKVSQKVVFWLIIIITVVLKILIIPYNMIDSGDNATRVWNALWWAEKPFFVMPESGNPLWFYFMGPIIKITGEIYYSPIISMIILMTIAAIFVYKATFLFTSYQAALLAYFIATLNPVIFRLNYQPYPQQLLIVSICIMLYFLLKALFGEKSVKNFAYAGIFGFFALASRPEALFLMIPLIIYVLLTRKKGTIYFALIPLLFEVFWIVVSLSVYGSFFKSFEVDAAYASPLSFQGISLGLRLKGLFIPYYYLILGITFLLFYYFLRGIIYSNKKYPKVITLLILVLIFIPCLVSGIAGMRSALYHSTNYIYLAFVIGPIFAAIGLNNDLSKINRNLTKYAYAVLIIISCIPLSYIKEFVPEKYNKLFPKVIQFIVTADEPTETRKLVTFIDANISENPALIFDSDENSSSIFYVPFRTKLAPPEKVLISGYNVPLDTDGLRIEIDKFMKKNPRGIIMTRKSTTIMNRIFSELLNNKPYRRNDIILQQETDKWYIYVYGQPE